MKKIVLVLLYLILSCRLLAAEDEFEVEELPSAAEAGQANENRAIKLLGIQAQLSLGEENISGYCDLRSSKDNRGNVVFKVVILGFLFLSSYLISFRWRGSFNGGSDAMTLVIAGCVFAFSIFKNSIFLQEFAIWYLAIQCVLSYFLAGVPKLRRREWWNGKSLQAILKLPQYEIPEVLCRIAPQQFLLVFFSFLVIVFELSFPLALVNAHLALFLMGAGFLFHLFNYYALGLNRFVFIWLATYPALYYCASNHIN